jgi:hypothetical protein
VVDRPAGVIAAPSSAFTEVAVDRLNVLNPYAVPDCRASTAAGDTTRLDSLARRVDRPGIASRRSGQTLTTLPGRRSSRSSA